MKKKKPLKSNLNWHDKNISSTIWLKDNDNYITDYRNLDMHDITSIQYISKTASPYVEFEPYDIPNKPMLRAQKVKITFNSNQREILNRWFSSCEDVYNKCVDMLNSKKVDMKTMKDYKKLKIKVFKKLYGDNPKPAPYSVLTYEVKVFTENLKSCLTNLRKGNIKDYKMTHKNTTKNQTITIQKTSINEKGIFSRLLGPQKHNGRIVEADCKLTFNKLFNTYFLHIPIYKPKKEIQDRDSVVALDPGEAVFMTYHSFEECGKIGILLRKKILNYRNIISMWQSRKSKKGCEEKYGITVNKMERLICKYYNKIKGVVNELHKKTAIFLCNKYKRILIPEFQTQQMVKGTVDRTTKHYKLRSSRLKVLYEKKDKMKKEDFIAQRRNIFKIYNNEDNKGKTLEEIKKSIKERTKKFQLSRKTKFVLNMLSHYKFKQYLLAKAEEYDCLVKVVTEEYTSMTCTKCGFKSSCYEGRMKKCLKCSFKIDRDINGSRNILIKNINEVIRPFRTIPE